MDNPPDYIVQSDGPVYDVLAREFWFKTIAEAYRGLGVVFAQYSVHPESSHLLFEGWTVRPAETGLPRWKPFTSSPAPIPDDVDLHWPQRRDVEGD